MFDYVFQLSSAQTTTTIETANMRCRILINFLVFFLHSDILCRNIQSGGEKTANKNKYTWQLFIPNRSTTLTANTAVRNTGGIGRRPGALRLYTESTIVFCHCKSRWAFSWHKNCGCPYIKRAPFVVFAFRLWVSCPRFGRTAAAVLFFFWALPRYRNAVIDY